MHHQDALKKLDIEIPPPLEIEEYSLRAVIIHSGDAVEGHFLCAAIEGRSCVMIDDNAVTEIDSSSKELSYASMLIYSL